MIGTVPSKTATILALLVGLLFPWNLQATQTQNPGAVIINQAIVASDTAPGCSAEQPAKMATRPTASFLMPASRPAPGDLAVPQNSPASQAISIAPQRPAKTQTSNQLVGNALDQGPNEVVAASKVPTVGLGSRIAPYSELQAVTKGQGGAIQAHHILEQRHLRAWGFTEAEIANAPAQVLGRTEHQALSRALSEALPTGTRYSPSQVWSKYQEVYKSYPGYLDAIKSYFQ